MERRWRPCWSPQPLRHPRHQDPQHLVAVDARGRPRRHPGGPFHPTPRLGGIAVFVAVVTAALLDLPGWDSLWVLLLAASVPLFLSGAAEDLGYPVAPAGRLVAALASSVLVVWFGETWISHTGVPWLDVLLAWSPLAIVVSVVAAAAVAHAFNLIDGLNGLAGSTA